MKKLIKGNNYNFLINNVNCILSGLCVDGYNKKFWESDWVITKRQSSKFFKIAVDFLTDEDFKEYVERYLDLDRSLGEWNKL